MLKTQANNTERLGPKVGDKGFFQFCSTNICVMISTLVFVIEKYSEDVKQDEKHVPDLLESIMKGSGLVKEKLTA